jgi:hypothetical protein
MVGRLKDDWFSNFVVTSIIICVFLSVYYVAFDKTTKDASLTVYAVDLDSIASRSKSEALRRIMEGEENVKIEDITNNYRLKIKHHMDNLPGKVLILDKSIIVGGEVNEIKVE